MSRTGFEKIGGYSGLRTKYMNAMADEVLNGTYKCGVPRSDAFIMLRDAKSSDLPWPGFVFGQTPATIWYWCADQVSFLGTYRLLGKRAETSEPRECALSVNLCLIASYI